MNSSRRQSRLSVILGVFSVALLLASTTTLGAHESENDGHIPANTNYGFEVVGRDLLAGVEDGLYTDVWSHNGFAYVGTFQDPDCTNAGVFIVDIEQAIDNYANGIEEGATVGEIKSAPNTRVNDVKVHTVGDTDVLIMTEEMCGDAVQGAATALANINKGCDTDADGNDDCERLKNKSDQGPDSQKGNGGISLYDVTDPTTPKPLEKNFASVERVTIAAGPSLATTSSRASSMARTKVVFQRFSPASIVSTKTSSWRSRSIMAPR